MRTFGTFGAFYRGKSAHLAPPREGKEHVWHIFGMYLTATSRDGNAQFDVSQRGKNALLAHLAHFTVFLMIRRPPRYTLMPYTTIFPSRTGPRRPGTETRNLTSPREGKAHFWHIWRILQREKRTFGASQRGKRARLAHFRHVLDRDVPGRKRAI